MTEITTVARPYAKAAFEHARAAGQLADWSSMLALSAAVVQDAEFHHYLARPSLSAAEQADAVIKVCGDRLDAAGRNFIATLAVHKRLGALPAVRDRFEALRAEAEGAVDVDVISAFPLDDTQSRELANALGSKLSRQVNLTSSVDAGLLGGVVIRAGDTVIDASVRGKLAKLGATLNS